jgi:hypothetical protein
MKDEDTAIERQRLISEEMIVEQISAIVEAHKRAMDGLEKQEKEVRNKVEDQGEIIEFKKGLMGSID